MASSSEATPSRATGASYRQIAAATGLSTISVKRIVGRARGQGVVGLGDVERAAADYGRAQTFADRIRAQAHLRATAYEAMEAGADRHRVAEAVGVAIDSFDEFIEGVGSPY